VTPSPPWQQLMAPTQVSVSFVKGVRLLSAATDMTKIVMPEISVGRAEALRWKSAFEPAYMVRVPAQERNRPHDAWGDDRFMQHALKDRFPVDIEDQIERGWRR